MLKVLRLDSGAKLPTCAHPGEDLGYDVYALEDAHLSQGVPTIIRTGIAAYFKDASAASYGLLLRDRSSLAAAGIMVSGGVIDSGYMGEILVVLTKLDANLPHLIHAGDKIAQMIPIPVLTASGVEEITELPTSSRGGNGFGSTGR